MTRKKKKMNRQRCRILGNKNCILGSRAKANMQDIANEEQFFWNFQGFLFISLFH